MDTRPASHPPADVLLALGSGKLDDATASAVFSHVEVCPECLKTAGRQSDDSFLDKLRAARGYSGTPAPSKVLSSFPGAGNAAPIPTTSEIPALTILPELRDHPQYEVLRELGRGGMGVVYLAKNKLMDRLEVLKVVNKQLLGDAGAAERFLREIRSAAQLNHPNIVTAYSALQVGDVLLFSMEYIEGQDLAQVVKARGPLPAAHSGSYIVQAARGLQHAFEKGMVHRDVKPQNLILDGKTNIVKILDFGLAKATRTTTGAAAEGLTGLNMLMGTPDYMAPEQARDAANVDIRADIYSLGCTLYCLLAGRAPFAGGSLATKIAAHQFSEPEPVESLRQDLPPGLAGIVRKMMTKDPAQRYQKPEEVVQALTSCFNEKPAPLRKKWLMAAGGAAAALMLMGLIGLSAVGVFRVKTADGILVVEVNEPNAEVFVDGDRMAVSWNEGGTKAEIHVKPGTRKVVVQKDGFSAAGKELTFNDGVREVFTARLVSEERHMAKAGAPPEKSPPPPAPVGTGENPADVTNSIGMKLKLIKPGTFLMGSPKEEQGRKDNEGPQHEVEITKAFYMGVYPVTRGQFAAFAKDADYTTEAEIEGIGYGYNPFKNQFESGKYTWRKLGFKQTDDHPVVEVTWNDATAFCAWLSKKEGKHYELPTEAEWEYACRAGTQTRFWCGDEDASLKGNANIADASFKEKCPGVIWAATWDDGYAFTSPVGSFKANPWGLYDMHGNVWQWCADYYDATYYQNSDKKDPLNSSKSGARVLRGGCWFIPARGCRAAFRDMRELGGLNDRGGFRVALRLD
jgi:formylglycine-generating enzyme required for sulfatase activity